MAPAMPAPTTAVGYDAPPLDDEEAAALVEEAPAAPPVVVRVAGWTEETTVELFTEPMLALIAIDVALPTEVG